MLFFLVSDYWPSGTRWGPNIWTNSSRQRETIGMKVMEVLRIANNGVTEKTRFYVSNHAKPRTYLRRRSSRRKQEANRNHSVLTLARILNNNFDSTSYLITLTYDDDNLYNLLQSLPDAEDRHARVLSALDNDARNFVRRLRRAGTNALEYIFVASDLDGYTKSDVRPHIHMVVRSVDIGKVNQQLVVGTKSLTKIWGKAKVVAFRHLGTGDYTALAAYLLAQTREIPNRRSYTCNHNLERIIPVEYITDQKPDQPFELPAGAMILDQQHGGSEGEPILWRYIRYISSSTSLEEEYQYTSSARPPCTCPK